MLPSDDKNKTNEELTEKEILLKILTRLESIEKIVLPTKEYLTANEWKRLDENDIQGVDKVDEYNVYGFTRDGIHRNGTTRDDLDFDFDGWDKEGFHRNGTYHDDDGYDINGFTKYGIHKLTGTKYNPNGYDIDERRKL